jgi:hypothetical protein
MTAHSSDFAVLPYENTKNGDLGVSEVNYKTNTE